MRIGLVGCVKSKRAEPSAAEDLYTSTLFAGRRSHVERTCDRWFVLSAEHGLVLPSTVIEPYDVSLRGAGRAAQRRWSARVLAQLNTAVADLGSHTFEIHAGAPYWDHGLLEGLADAGAIVEIPTEHLNRGEQLAFYNGDPNPTGTTVNEAPTTSSGRYTTLGDHLHNLAQDSWTTSFADVEAVLGGQLPASARRHRPWWANSTSTPQGAAWLDAGWKATDVDMRAESLRFVRVEQSPHPSASPAAPPTPASELPAPGQPTAEALGLLLRDPARCVPAGEFPHDQEVADAPGLYSWWADGVALDSLGKTFGETLTQPIYAGQAGATTAIAGVERQATLSSRILQNHIGGSISSSTFRKTLAACLRDQLGLDLSQPGRLTTESNAALSEWIRTHLRVAIVPVPDRSELMDLEDQVLAAIDPPLNLMGRPVTDVRARLKALRKQLG